MAVAQLSERRRTERTEQTECIREIDDATEDHDFDAETVNAGPVNAGHRPVCMKYLHRPVCIKDVGPIDSQHLTCHEEEFATSTPSFKVEIDPEPSEIDLHELDGLAMALDR